LKKFLIFLSIILLLGAGYFTYDQWVKNANLSIWSFIPTNSLMVYETTEPIRSLSDVQQTDLWTNLTYIPSFNKINHTVDLLDSISADGAFKNLFGKTNTLITVNNTGSNSFDFLFVVDLKNLSQQTFISQALEHFIQSGYHRKSRTYNDFTITEIVSQGQTFSFMLYKHFFIGSFSALLVEDAIRTVEESRTGGFIYQNEELMPLTKLVKDQGNLYVNVNRVADVVNLFNADNIAFDLAKSAFLDVKVGNEYLNLNGFTFANQDNQYLNIFNGIESGGFDLIEMIPNNTSWFYHLSAENPVQLGEAMMQYNQKQDPSISSTQQKILNDFDFDVNYSYRLLDDELAILTLESPGVDATNKILILESKDMTETLRYFDAVSERIFASTGDSIYIEQYADYTIHKLPIKDYARTLLGKLGSGLEETYYLPFRNYLILSNTPENLKNLIISIENENTWSKSIRVNNFLEQTNRESCFSYFVNTSHAWGQMTAAMKPEWKEFFKKEETSFRNLELAAFQFSALDDKYYTNITLYQPFLPNRSIPERIETQQTISLASPILSKPWIVTNHNNKQREVLIQDSTNQLYLIGADFSALWDLGINEPIIGKPAQVDYYKNGKLQYAFATKSAIHIIDRTGKYLPEFPKKLKGVEIKDFNIIDYDNSKKYRFAIIDHLGNLYLTDKNVKPLKGWNPKKFKSPLYQAPIHKRISGKDVFVIVEESGRISLLNRRGIAIPGFPVDIKSELGSRVDIRQSSKFENSFITLLNTKGELFEYSFTGRLTKKEQLYKPAITSEFRVISNIAGDGFKIVRSYENTVEILDDTGIPLFTKEFNEASDLNFQYYNLGAGKEFIVITDPKSAYLYFYDLDGQLLTGSPLAGTHPISLLQSDNSYLVYRIIDNTLEVIKLTF
jgi:hypothetical protein